MIVWGGGWVGRTESESAWKGRSPRTGKQGMGKAKVAEVVFGLSVSGTKRPESGPAAGHTLQEQKDYFSSSSAGT